MKMLRNRLKRASHTVEVQRYETVEIIEMRRQISGFACKFVSEHVDSSVRRY